MKKLTSLMMVAALAVSITACGATANTNASASSATDKSTATGEAGNDTVTITYPEYMIPGAMTVTDFGEDESGKGILQGPTRQRGCFGS